MRDRRCARCQERVDQRKWHMHDAQALAMQMHGSVMETREENCRTHFDPRLTASTGIRVEGRHDEGGV